jgi:tetratricopeptide (TPR) repeat protein
LPELDFAPDEWLDEPATRQALAVGLLAFALQLAVDFHFKIPALAMAFAVVGALLAQRARPGSASGGARTLPGRLGSFAVAFGWSVLVIIFVVPHWRAEALRLHAREAIDRMAGKRLEPEAYRATLRSIRPALAHSVVLDPTNAQAWADMAYADALWAYITPAELHALGDAAEAAANQALALAPDVAEFWVRRGVALDMRGQWFDASLAFSKATVLAPNTSWVWFYQADHFSHKPTERGLTEAALALCLRLDPGNPDGLALRQRLAISQRDKP